jgi:hypothetical protein
VVTALSIVTTVFLLRLYHKVEAVGPKVKVVISFLRRLVGLEERVAPPAGDTVGVGRYADVIHDVDMKSDADIQLGQYGKMCSSPGKAPHGKAFHAIVDTSFSKGKPHVHESKEEGTVGKGEGTVGKGATQAGGGEMTWQVVAETLDYVCLRLFLSIIVGMTTVLVIALFCGTTPLNP